VRQFGSRATMSLVSPFSHRWSISHFSRLLDSELKKFPTIYTYIDLGQNDGMRVLFSKTKNSFSIQLYSDDELDNIICSASIVNERRGQVRTKGEARDNRGTN